MHMKTVILVIVVLQCLFGSADAEDLLDEYISPYFCTSEKEFKMNKLGDDKAKEIGKTVLTTEHLIKWK